MTTADGRTARGVDPTVELQARLRDWARGIDALEAATELLIRAGLARQGHPWIRREQSREHMSDRVWVDFSAVSAYVGSMTPDERRTLLFAASLSDVDGAPPVRLGDLVQVRPPRLSLMLAALAHAGGRRDAWADRAPAP
jgi:hypothetical protein